MDLKYVDCTVSKLFSFPTRKIEMQGRYNKNMAIIDDFSKSPAAVSLEQQSHGVLTLYFRQDMKHFTISWLAI